MRVSTFWLLMLLCWLQIEFFFGQNGLYEYIKLNDDISCKVKDIFYLKSRNIKLFSRLLHWDFDFKNVLRSIHKIDLI